MGTAIELRRQRRHTQIELDAHALYLRTECDMTFAQIAAEMGIALSNAHTRVRRAYARLPGRKASEQKAADLAELDELERVAWTILERPHVIVTPGGKVATIKVVDEETGLVREIPLPDDGPALDALDRILKVQERRTKLLGNDAPVRHRMMVVPQDAVDAEIAELKREQLIDEDDDADLADLL